MYYLSKADLLRIGIQWEGVIDKIREAVHTLKEGDFAQPVKPYLRYNNPTNRIIAMPAYVGGKVSFAGIKWIASFPENIEKNLPRASSVTILNDAKTGVPGCIINTSLLSGIRTAAVTGLVIRTCLEQKEKTDFTIGIIGFGPIGQLHLDMLHAIMGDKIAAVKLFDLRPIDPARIPASIRRKVTIVSSWEEAFESADIFITCTVSKKPYIDKAPPRGSLQLNVSLRDYSPDFADYADYIIVDDWTEVCRENTDIEVMHKTKGLQKEDTHSLVDLVCHDILRNIKDEEIIMFNPMGMAVFDIATAAYVYDQAKASGIGTVLADD